MDVKFRRAYGEKNLPRDVYNFLSAELPANETLGIQIVNQVAEVKDVSPLEMQPLYGAIDLEALNGLFEDRDGVSRVGQVSFKYGGCDITVRSSGQIAVQPLCEDDSCTD